MNRLVLIIIILYASLVQALESPHRGVELSVHHGGVFLKVAPYKFTIPIPSGVPSSNDRNQHRTERFSSADRIEVKSSCRRVVGGHTGGVKTPWWSPLSGDQISLRS